jgi:hypothetical protein
MRITRTIVGVFLVASAMGAGEISEAKRAEVIAVGQEASQLLMSSLKSALMKAMQEGGPAHAVGFCSEQALNLTDEAQSQLNGLGIKRTSHRFRNPANAPDHRENQALDRFETGAASERPAQLVEKFSQNGATVYRYYQPIYMATFCLTCHGDNVPANVQQVLDERYPDDQAEGYQEGDFRGLIRVEIPAERLPRK